MPTIDPAIIPSISAGSLFDRFTTDSTLNVRWLTPTDPVYYEAVNRPMADITLRQLIIAKALDALQLRLSHQSLFPFLIPCKISAGSSEIETPPSWIWDMHVSLPSKWEYLRLEKIKRISGSNGGSSGSSGTITGTLRLIFSGQQQNSSTEVALFYADYQIDSNFTYQIVRIQAVTNTEESNPIDSGEAATEDGFLIFRTLDYVTDSVALAFLLALAPPTDTTDSNHDGYYDHPAVYEVESTPAGGPAVTDDFFVSALNHGTGLLVVSAWNAIPAANADINTWLESTNYPFRNGATRTSSNGITIPQALFTEFDMVIPTFDEATGDVSKKNSPVWISAIERVDGLASELKFIFSTHTIKDETTPPSEIQFATLNLKRTYTSGQIVNIVATQNLLKGSSALNADFMQGFGTGHVVLSSLWGTTGDEVGTFFDAFLAIIATPAQAIYGKAATILSALALSRNSRYVPTKGESFALVGTTARRSTPIYPSDSNRYITEQDNGLGDSVDFRTVSGFTENEDIENIAYKGGLVHPIVRLVVDASGGHHNYDTDIKPRLECLLGRPIRYADFWDNGTVLAFYNGDAWITL